MTTRPNVMRDGVVQPMDDATYTQYLVDAAGALAAVQLEASGRVDREAEHTRLQYITGGSGQAMVYEQKAIEAARYAQVGDAGAPYPLLDASVGIEAADRARVATIVTGIATAWAQVAAGIETLRLGKKKLIAEATTVDGVAAVFPIAWPSP